MLVRCDLREVRSNDAQNLVHLLLGGRLQQLLAKVIGKLVHHERPKVVVQGGEQFCGKRAAILLLETSLQSPAALMLLR